MPTHLVPAGRTRCSLAVIALVAMSTALAAGAAPAVAKPRQTSYPVTVNNCGNRLTIERAPKRVLAGSGGLGETLAALGVANKLVGLFVAPERYGKLNPGRSGTDYLARLRRVKVLNPKGGGNTSAEAVLGARPDFVFSQGQASREGGPSAQQYERAGITVFQYSFYCGLPRLQSIERDIADIRNLGIIVNVQARADALIKHIRRQIASVRKAIAGRRKVRTIYWDAYDDSATLVPCCLFHDVVAKAGGVAMFKQSTYARPASKELIAASDVEAVVGIDYGDFNQWLPSMRAVIRNTPAGKSGRKIGRIPNFFGMPIRDGEHVRAVARALHPSAFGR